MHPPSRSHSIRHLTSQIFYHKRWFSRFCYASGGFESGTRTSTSIKDSPLLHLSASVSTQNQPSMPCPCEIEIVVASAAHLEHQRSTLGLLVTTIPSLALAPICPPNPESKTYPSSKCLHLFNANCALVLHAVHSSLNTTFFVVLAFLWKTGFV